MANRLFRNEGTETISLQAYGLDDLKPGEQVSLSGDYLPPIIIENHPGLVDATNEVVEEGRVS